MLRSFKWKMALFAAGTSGLIFVAFSLLFLGMIRRVGLERIDRHLALMAEAQLRPPPFTQQWSRLDSSLSALYGEAQTRPYILRVIDRDGAAVYTSPRWPAELTLEALGLSDYARLPPEAGTPDQQPAPFARQPRGGADGREPPPEERAPPDAFVPLGGRMAGRPVRGAFDGAPFPPRDALRPPRFLTVPVKGKPWRMIALRNRAMMIVLGTDLSGFRDDLSRHWQAFAVAGPLALFLFAAGGWLLAGQALRPVRILTGVAEGITAKGLDRRVQAPGADREFQALIDVINGMLDRLEKSFRQAARFSADAAHELKTPLTILQGQLEQAVQQVAPASAEQQRYAGLLEEVQRLKGITRKLLLLAQSDAGQLRLCLEPVDLCGEVEALCEDLPLLAPGIALAKELAPDARVMADPDLLRQVLQNLFSNAAKYSRADGRIECRLRREGGDAVLTLANTADAEQRIDPKRLFDRFYRGDPSHTRRVDGSGLGLSLAREISRAHGGELALDPAETRDGWIAFRLTLPAADRGATA